MGINIFSTWGSSHRQGQDAEPQILPHEAEARQSAEAEPTYSSMDSSEDWKHHQVRTTRTSVVSSSHSFPILQWRQLHPQCSKMAVIRAMSSRFGRTWEDDKPTTAQWPGGPTDQFEQHWSSLWMEIENVNVW